MFAARQRYQQPLASLAGAVLLLLPGAALAQSAGEVEFSRGVGFAQTPGQTPRTLGKGLELREGDRLTTSDGSSAIIKLQDGTRMTVRPNSEVVITQYKFREAAADNSMVMQLLRGGLRAVTGAIARGSPNAARIQTNTATIGIRGTDFDARICSRDCGQEAARIADRGQPNAVQASAKVVNSQGDVSVVAPNGDRRRVVNGGAVYPGELVETGAGTRAVLAFRDESRVTVGPTTRFRVDNFVFDERNAGEGRFLVSLLRGSIRAVTGVIARANQRNVSFSTATATVGIRGTEVDMQCDGACAGEPAAETSGLSVYTWLGAVAVQRTGQTVADLLQAGQGVFIGTGGVRPLTAPFLPADLPRPGTVPVDTQQLFASNNVPETEEGLYAFVRDGHIEVATARQILHLGRGEAGVANNAGDAQRPATVPRFLQFDQIPLPNLRNPQLVGLLADAGVGRANRVCR